MKYDVIVSGKYKAEVTTDLDGKGGFTGQIVSPDFGTGAIRDGVQDGNQLKGTVSLDGYDADFVATTTGTGITGTLSYGWFFSESFAGSELPSMGEG